MPPDLQKEINLDQDNYIEINSDYYHTCKIVIKPAKQVTPDGTTVTEYVVKDELDIFQLKKILKSSFVKLEKNKATSKYELTLKEKDGDAVAKIEALDPIGQNESIWISIQPPTNENQFNLVIKKLAADVTHQEVLDAPPTRVFANLSSEPTDGRFYQNIVDSIVNMKQLGKGIPEFTKINYEVAHGKIDNYKKSDKIKIIDSLYLMPLPNYPFPAGVKRLFGKIKMKDEEKNLEYKVTIEELSQITTTTADGQFVFFIDDELVNNTKILNSKIKKYEFTLKAEKRVFKNNAFSWELVESTDKSIDPNFVVYNLGVMGETR